MLEINEKNRPKWDEVFNVNKIKYRMSIFNLKKKISIYKIN